MKYLFILFSIIYSLSLIGQTSIIAHKSHSGNTTDFSISDYEDNLGLPAPRLVEAIKLNDSTAVLVRIPAMTIDAKYYDTIVSNPIEKYMESYLKYRNLDRINLVGFDSLKTKILIERENEEKGSFHSPIKPKLNIYTLFYGITGLAAIFSFLLYQNRKLKIQIL